MPDCRAAANSSQWSHDGRAILSAILLTPPPQFAVSWWQEGGCSCCHHICIRNRRRREGKHQQHPASSSESKTSPRRSTADFCFDLLARTVTWPPSAPSEAVKVREPSSSLASRVEGRHGTWHTRRWEWSLASPRGWDCAGQGVEIVEGLFTSGSLRSQTREELWHIRNW